MQKKQKLVYWIFLLPSLLGVLLFYFVPFAYSLYYACIDNMGSRKFVGVKNFLKTLSNPLFQSAAKNSTVFLVVTVLFGMSLALVLSLCLQRIKKHRVFVVAVILLPLVVPSGSITYFWRVIFGENGLLFRLLIAIGMSHEAVLRSSFETSIMVVIYLWKNLSYNIILFWAGLNWIPQTYYEQMEMEGAGVWKQFRNVTWIYLAPTTFVALLMSIVNSFKVFKEVYLLYGAYPSSDVYMLQHYINNQMQAMNMPVLSSAAHILFLAIGFLLLSIFLIQKRITDCF